MENMYQTNDLKRLNRLKNKGILLQPNEFSIRYILGFAQAYHVKRIAGKRFLEVILN